MIAPWLLWTAISWLTLSFATAAVLLIDIYLRGHRQRMRVMEAVWPITALYFGPFTWPFYARYGRPQSERWQQEHGDPPPKPRWATTAIGVTHCGAGCTLGDIIAETLVFWFGLTIAGSTLLAEMTGDYVLALALGVAFQYFAIAPMRGLGVRQGLVAALKADFLSLTAFELGLFGWMALMSLVFFTSPHLLPNSPVYWFMMQIGMVLGFFTSYPVNAWLIRKGIKESM